MPSFLPPLVMGQFYPVPEWKIILETDVSLEHRVLNFCLRSRGSPRLAPDVHTTMLTFSVALLLKR